MKTRRLPAEGTFLRGIYDALYEKRGTPVDLTTVPYNGSIKSKSPISMAVRNLVDYYDCDIRFVARDKTHILDAEFIGRDWVRYDLSKAS